MSSSSLLLSFSLSLSLSDSSGAATSPFVIDQAIEAMYTAKMPIAIPPTILHMSWWPNSLNPAISAVKRSNNRVYIFELLSKTIGFLSLRNMRPREKAPRMLEMAEPTTLPTASEERWRAMDITTTASFLEDQI